MQRTHQALRQMRELSEAGVPFSMEFISHSRKAKSSNGVKRVEKAMLRTGLSEDHSDVSNILVAYTDLKDDEPRFFYAPLLLKFNDHIICDTEQ